MVTRRIVLKEVADAAVAIVAARPEGFRYRDVLAQEDDPIAERVEYLAAAVEDIDTATLDCKYVLHGVGPEPTERPGCIVGEILFAIGVPMEVLVAMDATDEPVISYDGGRVLEDHGYVLSPAARAYLSSAQGNQDVGATWAASIRTAMTVATHPILID